MRRLYEDHATIAPVAAAFVVTATAIAGCHKPVSEPMIISAQAV
jgi:hypothetical protein